MRSADAHRLNRSCRNLNGNHDHEHSGCSHRRGIVQNHAERAMVGTLCIAMDVGHLSHEQKHQQKKTNERGRAQDTLVLAPPLASRCLFRCWQLQLLYPCSRITYD